MTDEQIKDLIEAISDINNDMPTWLSLIIGGILSIGGSIIFDLYKNYKETKDVKTQIKITENRLIEYLGFLIPDDDNAYKVSGLVLDVNQKVEDTLLQLVNLKNSINLNTEELEKVLINTIYIKQSVALNDLKRSDALSSDTLKSIKKKAIQIKSAVYKQRS